MTMTLKKYLKEFKLDAISLVSDQGYSAREAAESLGINYNVLGRCIREHQSSDISAFKGNGKLSAWQIECRAS